MFCTKCGHQMDAIATFCPNCGAPAGPAVVIDVPKVEKKLVRPMGKNWMAGVCAGFADYFGVDVTLVRVVWLATVILAGTGILAYIICWIIMPKAYSKSITV